MSFPAWLRGVRYRGAIQKGTLGWQWLLPPQGSYACNFLSDLGGLIHCTNLPPSSLRWKTRADTDIILSLPRRIPAKAANSSKRLVNPRTPTLVRRLFSQCSMDADPVRAKIPSPVSSKNLYCGPMAASIFAAYSRNLMPLLTTSSCQGFCERRKVKL